MENFKPVGIYIDKYQIGTGKNGIQSHKEWTSEDVDNPVYSKKRPLSIKQQEQIFIKDRQEQGAKDFDKGARIGLGLIRLHPTYGIAMNIVDMIEAGKNKNSSDYLSNMLGGMGKSVNQLGNYTASPTPTTDKRKVFRDKRAKPMGLPLKGLGYMMSAQDYINDALDLYNTIRE